jgi:hypothetical protein
VKDDVGTLERSNELRLLGNITLDVFHGLQWKDDAIYEPRPDTHITTMKEDKSVLTGDYNKHTTYVTHTPTSTFTFMSSSFLQGAISQSVTL